MPNHHHASVIQRRLGLKKVLAIAVIGAATTVFNPLLSTTAQAGSITGYKGFEQSFGFKGDQPIKGLSFKQIASSQPGNVFYAGDEPTLTFQVVNDSDKALARTGKLTVVEYATETDPDDTFTMYVKKVKDVGTAPVVINTPAKGFSDIAVKVPLPARFGAYAIVFEVDGEKTLVASCVRSVSAEPGKVQYPTYALDMGNIAFAPVMKRLGIKGMRNEINWVSANDPHYADEKAKLAATLKTLADNDLTVMWTLEGGNGDKMPMKHIRGLLNDKDEGKMDYPGDFVSSPEFDDDIRKWCKDVTETFGWPKGPVNAIELWNEPWEGSSISGWGADMLRYREIYTHMAMGIEDGRKAGNTSVLIGGACSSMNTEDKLFPDGNDEPFLKWLDFTSIHYQPMCAQPAVIKRFAQRKSPNGPTRAWDTESWIANSEDRVAAVIALMRAEGLSRTAGVFHDAVRDIQEVDAHREGGKTEHVTLIQTNAAGGAVAAVQKFIGQRDFKELLFKNGLPWVFVFNGADGKPDDGTVVIVGDLGGSTDRKLLLFRNVLGLEARKRADVLQKELAALPADASKEVIAAALKKIKTAEVLDQASMTFGDDSAHTIEYDFFGNPLPSAGGKITVPLNGLGYFVRTDGSAGSFARLLASLKSARVEGYEPVDVVAHDLLGRVESKPKLRLTLTNILNRPIHGKLDAKLGALTLATASQDVELAANETKEIAIPITGGIASADNTYPLAVTFDAGADGKKLHDETLHVNVIAHKTIAVDGNLDDWKDVLPQPIRSFPGAGKNLTEKAWLPFVKFEEHGGQGFASGFLSYDEKNFYFAAKIADSTPYEGNIRFANRDDDSYFYPDKSWNIREENGKTVRGDELHWPAGMRHFSYRRNPELPSGDGTDNVQIGFNVLPIEQTDWLPNPPGTMPRFMVTKSTDYEYALNQVAEKFGGGTELWRLAAPGMPRKHFYPRQPKVTAPGKKDGGPVDGGKLVMKREGNTRIVECAIPWTELPDVKKRLDAGEPIKFTFRVNDDKGPAYELNQNRSVSKADSYALHDFWATSWETETEFAFEK